MTTSKKTLRTIMRNRQAILAIIRYLNEESEFEEWILDNTDDDNVVVLEEFRELAYDE